MLQENEIQRRKEIHEYLATTHILSIVILFLSLLLSKKFADNGIYPAFNMRIFVIMSLAGVGVILLFNNVKRIEQNKLRILTSDVIYLLFPLATTILILHMFRDTISNLVAILLLPVVMAASFLGKNAGLVMAGVCTVVLLYSKMIFETDKSFFQLLESELFFIFIMFVMGWLTGGLTDVETERHEDMKANLLSLEEEIERREILEKQLLKLSRAIEQSPNIVIFTDSKGHIDYVNQMFSQVTGFSPEDVVGKNIYEINKPPDSIFNVLHMAEEPLADAAFHANPSQEQEESSQIKNSEIRFKTKYGEIRTGLLSVEIIEIDGIWYRVASINDITERKQAEEVLGFERRRLFSLLENLPVFFFLVKPDYSIHFANRFFRENFGVPGERPCYEVKYGRQNPCEPCPAFHVLETEISADWELALPNGRVYHFFCYPFKDYDGTTLLMKMGIDITEHKMFGKEIARLDRLHLVGEMAAGIGHEIRNPMTTVRGFLQFLGEKKENAHQIKYFDLMIEELDRANSIITEFLSLAKNRIVILEKKNLNDILRAILPLIQSDAIKKDNLVNMELGDIPDLLMDEKEIRQVVFNLARNGLEAMPANGELIIKTYKEKEEVVLAVCDQGEGIAREIIDKIGTPFFTTKDNGTGLGLAVCYSIAAKHKANIKIDTSPQGTTFSVRFGINV